MRREPAAPETNPTPGWFADPADRHEFRYHNGTAWTADVADGGRRFVDPLGSPAAAPPSVAPPSFPSASTTTPTSRNRIAVASLVCGVVAIGLGLVPFVFVVAVVAGIAAVVCGVIGIGRAGPAGHRRTLAIAGLAAGVAGLVAAVFGAVLTIALIDAVDRYEDPGPHDVDVVGCEREGRAWTASGTITNLDDEARSYTLSVDFVRAGTDNRRAGARVQLPDVAPGDAARFEVRRVVELDDVDCVVSAVDGPPPFGIDIGR